MELFNDLLPDPLPTEPMAIASAWLATAMAARQQPNPDAMVLATATPDGRPSARVVLCKDFDIERGRVSFVTNYDSRKGRELAENTRASLTEVKQQDFVLAARAMGAAAKAAKATGGVRSAMMPK